MTLLRDIARELRAMFMADIWLSGAVLALVALVAGLVLYGGAEPLVGGAALLGGSLLILVVASVREARRRSGARFD